jgi:hypothetical protein
MIKDPETEEVVETEDTKETSNEEIYWVDNETE